MIENNVSWFPGHMQKSTRLIKEIIGEIDLIIEIVDARAPTISSNNNLLKEIGNNKITLKIALKSDLAVNHSNLFYGSILDKNFKKKVINKIEEIMKEKIERKLKKGLVNPKIYVLVVGLPNVGKSSFINYMASKKQLITANQPGVTRKKQWLNVNNWIEMLDTPGIFHKKVEALNDLAILALIKTIKWEISPKEVIIEWAFNFYKTHYKLEFEQYYKVEMTNYHDFIDNFCQQKRLVLKNNVSDHERAIETIYKDISSGKICKINYEKEN